MGLMPAVEHAKRPGTNKLVEGSQARSVSVKEWQSKQSMYDPVLTLIYQLRKSCREV